MKVRICTCPDCKCETVYFCLFGRCKCKTCKVPSGSPKFLVHKEEYIIERDVEVMD